MTDNVVYLPVPKPRGEPVPEAERAAWARYQDVLQTWRAKPCGANGQELVAAYTELLQAIGCGDAHELVASFAERVRRAQMGAA